MKQSEQINKIVNRWQNQPPYPSAMPLNIKKILAQKGALFYSSSHTIELFEKAWLKIQDSRKEILLYDVRNNGLTFEVNCYTQQAVDNGKISSTGVWRPQGLCYLPSQIKTDNLACHHWQFTIPHSNPITRLGPHIVINIRSALSADHQLQELIGTFVHEGEHHYRFRINHDLKSAYPVETLYFNAQPVVCDPYWFTRQTPSFQTISGEKFADMYLDEAASLIQSHKPIAAISEKQYPSAEYLFTWPVRYLLNEIHFKINHNLLLPPHTPLRQGLIDDIYSKILVPSQNHSYLSKLSNAIACHYPELTPFDIDRICSNAGMIMRAEVPAFLAEIRAIYPGHSLLNSTTAYLLRAAEDLNCPVVVEKKSLNRASIKPLNNLRLSQSNTFPVATIPNAYTRSSQDFKKAWKEFTSDPRTRAFAKKFLYQSTCDVLNFISTFLQLKKNYEETGSKLNAIRLTSAELVINGLITNIFGPVVGVSLITGMHLCNAPLSIEQRLGAAETALFSMLQAYHRRLSLIATDPNPIHQLISTYLMLPTKQEVNKVCQSIYLDPTFRKALIENNGTRYATGLFASLQIALQHRLNNLRKAGATEKECGEYTDYFYTHYPEANPEYADGALLRDFFHEASQLRRKLSLKLAALSPKEEHDNPNHIDSEASLIEESLQEHPILELNHGIIFPPYLDSLLQLSEAAQGLKPSHLSPIHPTPEPATNEKSQTTQPASDVPPKEKSQKTPPPDQYMQKPKDKKQPLFSDTTIAIIRTPDGSALPGVNTKFLDWLTLGVGFTGSSFGVRMTWEFGKHFFTNVARGLPIFVGMFATLYGLQKLYLHMERKRIKKCGRRQQETFSDLEKANTSLEQLNQTLAQSYLTSLEKQQLIEQEKQRLETLQIEMRKRRNFDRRAVLYQSAEFHDEAAIAVQSAIDSLRALALQLQFEEMTDQVKKIFSSCDGESFIQQCQKWQTTQGAILNIKQMAELNALGESVFKLALDLALDASTHSLKKAKKLIEAADAITFQPLPNLVPIQLTNVSGFGDLNESTKNHINQYNNAIKELDHDVAQGIVPKQAFAKFYETVTPILSEWETQLAKRQAYENKHTGSQAGHRKANTVTASELKARVQYLQNQIAAAEAIQQQYAQTPAHTLGLEAVSEELDLLIKALAQNDQEFTRMYINFKAHKEQKTSLGQVGFNQQMMQRILRHTYAGNMKQASKLLEQYGQGVEEQELLTFNQFEQLIKEITPHVGNVYFQNQTLANLSEPLIHMLQSEVEQWAEKNKLKWQVPLAIYHGTKAIFPLLPEMVVSYIALHLMDKTSPLMSRFFAMPQSLSPEIALSKSIIRAHLFQSIQPYLHPLQTVRDMTRSWQSFQNNMPAVQTGLTLAQWANQWLASSIEQLPYEWQSYAKAILLKINSTLQMANTAVHWVHLLNLFNSVSKAPTPTEQASAFLRLCSGIIAGFTKGHNDDHELPDANTFLYRNSTIACLQMMGQLLSIANTRGGLKQTIIQPVFWLQTGIYLGKIYYDTYSLSAISKANLEALKIALDNVHQSKNISERKQHWNVVKILLEKQFGGLTYAHTSNATHPHEWINSVRIDYMTAVAMERHETLQTHLQNYLTQLEHSVQKPSEMDLSTLHHHSVKLNHSIQDILTLTQWLHSDSCTAYGYPAYLVVNLIILRLDTLTLSIDTIFQFPDEYQHALHAIESTMTKKWAHFSFKPVQEQLKKLIDNFLNRIIEHMNHERYLLSIYQEIHKHHPERQNHAQATVKATIKALLGLFKNMDKNWLNQLTDDQKSTLASYDEFVGTHNRMPPRSASQNQASQAHPRVSPLQELHLDTLPLSIQLVTSLQMKPASLLSSHSQKLKLISICGQKITALFVSTYGLGDSWSSIVKAMPNTSTPCFKTTHSPIPVISCHANGSEIKIAPPPNHYDCMVTSPIENASSVVKWMRLDFSSKTYAGGASDGHYQAAFSPVTGKYALIWGAGNGRFLQGIHSLTYWQQNDDHPILGMKFSPDEQWYFLLTSNSKHTEIQLQICSVVNQNIRGHRYTLPTLTHDNFKDLLQHIHFEPDRRAVVIYDKERLIELPFNVAARIDDQSMAIYPLDNDSVPRFTAPMGNGNHLQVSKNCVSFFNLHTRQSRELPHPEITSASFIEVNGNQLITGQDDGKISIYRY